MEVIELIKELAKLELQRRLIEERIEQLREQLVGIPLKRLTVPVDGKRVTVYKRRGVVVKDRRKLPEEYITVRQVKAVDLKKVAENIGKDKRLEGVVEEVTKIGVMVKDE